MFVLRQIASKINTNVVSMSVICLLLFMTISILSSSLALRHTMQKELKEMTPVDLNLYKTVSSKDDSNEQILETLTHNGLNQNVLKEIEEIVIYEEKNLTWKDFFGDKYEEIKALFPGLQYKKAEELVKVSDYNRIARLYGIKEYELKDNEYIVLCDFDSQVQLRNKVLVEGGHDLEIAGKQYHSKYDKCQEGFIEMSTSHTNTGIILVPDSCPFTEAMKEKYFLAANYCADTEEEKYEIEKIFAGGDSSNLVQNLNENGIDIDGHTKISLMEASIGLATIVTFIAIYLGIIFLIASSAILALKQLTESSDHKGRYMILRKIGCDEKMINRTLLKQIAVFFGMPLVLAIIHSIFGIQFALHVMSGLASKEELLPSMIATVFIIGGIYGAYFLATYNGSKNIMKEE